MFEVGVEGRFRASHRLVGDFGPATLPHDHDYRVRLAVRGPALRDDGTLCDIGWLRGVLDDLLASLEGRNLNEAHPFEHENPTAEAVARHVLEEVASRLAEPAVAALAVEVWETPDAYARYEAPLD